MSDSLQYISLVAELITIGVSAIALYNSIKKSIENLITKLIEEKITKYHEDIVKKYNELLLAYENRSQMIERAYENRSAQLENMIKILDIRISKLEDIYANDPKKGKW